MWPSELCAKDTALKTGRESLGDRNGRSTLASVTLSGKWGHRASLWALSFAMGNKKAKRKGFKCPLFVTVFLHWLLLCLPT